MSKKVLTIIADFNGAYDKEYVKDLFANVSSDLIELVVLNSDYSNNDYSIVFVNEQSSINRLKKSINIATGDYITFVNKGDCFYKNSLNNIIEHLRKKDIDVFSCSVINYTNGYNIDKSFKSNSKKEYTNTQLNQLPTLLKGQFIKRKLINDIKIDYVDNSLEMDILCQVNQKAKIFLNITKEILAFKDSQYFIPLLNDNNLPGFFNRYIQESDLDNITQHYLLMEMKKLLVPASIKHRANQLSLNEKEKYINNIKLILSNISISIINNVSSIIMPYKNYLIGLKEGEQYKDNLYIRLDDKNTAYISYKENSLFNLNSVNNFLIHIIESKNNILYVEGLDYYSFLGDDFDLVALDDQNNVYEAQTFKWTLHDKNGFIGENVYKGRRFRYEIPLDMIKHISFKIRNKKNNSYYTLVPSFGNYAKIVKKVKASYYAKDNYIITFRRKGLQVLKNNFKNHFKHEIKLLLKIIKDKKIEIAVLRILYHFFSFFNKKQIWLIRDNEKRAKDSGSEMFKFYSQNEYKDKVNAYFILDRNCSDYDKMKVYGKIIQPDSFKYKLYHLLANKLIDTRGGINGKYIFKDDYIYVNDLINWEYIWLIHGIMTRNESTWTNKFVLNAKLFATCNQREYESVLLEDNSYGYNQSEVALTGLPRHDSLFADKQKKILFLPTWRKHLAGDLIPGTSDRSYVKNFKENEYYQFYNSLINDERLLSVMRRKGYTGDFYLHPSFMKQCNDFVENDVIRVGKEPADTNLLIGQCSILITDYSSAQFEGAYLDTPVIYPQYDADTFSDNHTGNDGYFDYEKDGFGPVCYDLDSTVSSIISYIENDCENIEPYKTRAKEFFVYRDHNNSRRIFEKLLGESHNDKISFSIENDNVLMYQGNNLKNIVSKNDIIKIYNPLIHIISSISKIKMAEKSFLIHGNIIINEKDYKLPHKNFAINIGTFSKVIDLRYKKSNSLGNHYSFTCEVPYLDILMNKKSTPIFIVWKDDKGYGFRNYLKYQFALHNDTLSNKINRTLHFSKVRILKDINTSIFLRETIGNNVYVCIRDINVTDYPHEQFKLKIAYLCSKFLIFSKIKKSIVMYEKFASKYEESASVLFEKIISSGHKNTYFVIDKKSNYLSNIPDYVKRKIIYKYSFKHYLYFFMSTCFISTESMNHMIELNIADSKVTAKIIFGNYDYIFLQHGIMYMYCLENRSDFIKGQGFTKTSKVVVSSQTEANHFIEYGYFDQDDLIISGLPKFDKSKINKDADKILIMPTSRDFEYNVIRLTPTDSTYYKFAKNIIDQVPPELKSKIVFVGHPLLKDQLESTDLKQYMPNKFTYDELLKNTRLLITDYSSISYDAFYRGSNVLFCWEDKEMCLNSMGYKLMLNEDNVFADVSYSFNDLSNLISKNYYGHQSDEQIKKYRDIVSFYDNNNTGRCYKLLKDFKYLNKRKKTSINKVSILNLKKKVYTGDRRIHTQLELKYGGRTLVKNRDYKLIYINNKRVSRLAIVIIIGLNSFYGIKLRRFKICPSIAKYNVMGIKSNNQTLDISKIAVKDNKGKLLIKNKDYECLVEDINLNIKKLTIKGIKKYGGRITLYYDVRI